MNNYEVWAALPVVEVENLDWEPTQDDLDMYTPEEWAEQAREDAAYWFASRDL